MRTRRYTLEQFVDAVKGSYSVSGVLKKLGLRPTGCNYKLFHQRVEQNGIDCSHFSGQGHLKGKTHGWAKKTPTDQILVENSTYGGTTNEIKKRLIVEGYRERKCYNCNNTEWLGKPIPLELEHINGANRDNRVENLTLLCPNCHALTDTYRGKNQKRRVVKLPKTIKEKVQKTCYMCGKKISDSKSGLCGDCVHITKRKVVRPDIGVLLEEVRVNGFVKTGEKYGVSDNAIRKWTKCAHGEMANAADSQGSP